MTINQDALGEFNVLAPKKPEQAARSVEQLERAFFREVENRTLLKMSGGRFPVGCHMSGTHPIFVARDSGQHLTLHPCSGKMQYRQHIKKSCRLSGTGNPMKKDTFILDHLVIRVGHAWVEDHNKQYWGIVPPKCIQGPDRRHWSAYYDKGRAFPG